MGLLLASAIIGRASRTLLDTTGVQWPEAELLEHLSDAQRATVLHLPEANPKAAVIRLVEGPRQTIPNDGYSLIKVTRNMEIPDSDAEASGDSIRLVDEDSRNVNRKWTRVPDTKIPVRNYSYDTRDRKAFYVSPGGHRGATAATGQRIEIVYAASPPEITNADAVITLDDIYQPALVSYTLHRAHAKDSANVNADPARAAMYFEQFLTTLLGRQAVELRLHPGQQERVREN